MTAAEEARDRAEWLLGRAKAALAKVEVPEVRMASDAGLEAEARALEFELLRVVRTLRSVQALAREAAMDPRRRMAR